MKRIPVKVKRINHIHKWDKLVQAVKWLLEHHVLQDIVAFIVWLLDKLITK
ncbi:MAG: hypothetical protein VB064_07770 [Oscillospiraceae bacterium]|nr:hypothetical protein [Oscillospiraceae bacterium]